MDNYLAVEALTLARLRAEVSKVQSINVMTVGDLSDVLEKQQITPALYLIYAGDRVRGDAGRNEYGDVQVIEQQWLVVVAERNAGGAGDVRQDAGPIISEVLQALSGWRPGDAFAEFVRVNGPRPAYSSGFGYFPLMFSTILATD